MDTRITATELARRLSDILNRVRYKGERFVVVRNGDLVATITPARPRGVTLREIAEQLRGVPWPDDQFADDLEWAQTNQPPTPEPPWGN